MSLCLSMIVKNEAPVIKRCLRSVKPFIDSYSISDTGSTDNTIDLIREELDGIPGVLVNDPWQDFSTNRNLSLSRCIGTHVLFLDADETLVNNGEPLVLDPEYDSFAFRVLAPNMQDWLTRIIRNDSRFEWRNKIHEYLNCEGENRYTRIENFCIAPFYDSNRNRLGDKFARDLKIFENEPPTDRNVFYHAQTLDGLGRNEDAIKKFYERADMGGWDQEVYYSLYQAGRLMAVQNYPFDQVASALYRAYRYRPSRHEALVLLCQLLSEHGGHNASYQISLIEPKPTEDTLLVDHRSFWQVFIEHGLAAYHLGKHEESQIAFLKAEEIVAGSPYPENLLTLSQVYFRTEQFASCAAVSRKAIAIRPDCSEAYINICAAENALGNFAEGKKAGQQALLLQHDSKLAKSNLRFSIDALDRKEEEIYCSLWKAADQMGSEHSFHEIASALYGAYSYRPTRFEALVKLCQMLRQRRQYAEAYRLSLVESHPNEDSLFVDRRAPWKILIEHALAAHRLGQFDESYKYFYRVAGISAKWTSPDDFLDLSLAYYQTKLYHDCIETALKAINLRPNSAAAYNNIAVSYKTLGEWDLAINAANEALRINPDFQLAKNNLAAAKAEKAKYLSSPDAPRFSADWFGSNIENWTKELSHYIGKPNLRFLEIGCFEGRATRWMLDNILTDTSSSIEVIDTFEGSPENHVDAFEFVGDLLSLRKTFEHNIHPFAGRVEIHQSLSHDALQEIAPKRHAYYDFIYIDGSHHQDDVYRDAELSWPLLKSGGILAFDDYEYFREDPKTGEKQIPKIGIDRFLAGREREFVLLHKGWQLHIRKSFQFSFTS